MPKKTESSTPLREPTYYILLSLRLGSKHGYAILKDVDALSGNTIRLSAGTLYEALARLLEQGLIEREDNEPGSNGNGYPGKPRKTYRLTPQGSQVLQGEIARLQGLLEAANRSLETRREGV